MKTYLECIPCFFRQAIEGARITVADETTKKEIIDKVALLIPSFSLETAPPEMGKAIHQLIQEVTAISDPYKELKDKSNTAVLNIYPKLKEIIGSTDDKLLTAVKLAIAGNIIDYGAQSSLDLEKEIEKIFAEDFKLLEKKHEQFFQYAEFRMDLEKAGNILYLADNAGETVFDRILLEEISESLPGIEQIVYAVKEKPIINDALVEDALYAGVDKYARVISSGSDAPGTVLSLGTKEFLDIFEKSDLIISKGQGNYESLSDQKRPIYFLLKIKCPVVGRNINCKVGDMVLKRGNHFKL